MIGVYGQKNHKAHLCPKVILPKSDNYPYLVEIPELTFSNRTNEK